MRVDVPIVAVPGICSDFPNLLPYSEKDWRRSGGEMLRMVCLRNRTEGKIGPSQKVSPRMCTRGACGVFKRGAAPVSVGLHRDGAEVRGRLWGRGSLPGHTAPHAWYLAASREGGLGFLELSA